MDYPLMMDDAQRIDCRRQCHEMGLDRVQHLLHDRALPAEWRQEAGFWSDEEQLKRQHRASGDTGRGLFAAASALVAVAFVAWLE